MTEETEPSMEEILSSIRRILSTEEGVKTVGEKIPSDIVEGTLSQPQSNDVMDLTPDMLCQDENNAEEKPIEHHSDMELLSEETVQASTDQLSNLTAHLIHSNADAVDNKGPEASSSHDSLETLVTSLLRPYLKQWLDEHLPAIVERIVKKEVERLTDKVC